MRGCFLILNYKDSDITQEAVRHLKELDDINECSIIIFDNGSDNGSLELLNRVYADDDRVIVGGSEANLGFSEGNNAAYKLALAHCDHYDFAVAMNSDVMIYQKDFIGRIKKHIEEGEFAVMGPDIFNSPRKAHDNPLFSEIPSAEEIERHISSHEYQLKNIGATVSKLRIRSVLARVLPERVFMIYRKIRKDHNSDNYWKKQYDPVLNGCCLIYLRQYLEHETLLFEPDTFLYGEEILLSLKCKTRGYRILYDPALQIEHRESVSTKAGKTSEEYIKQKNEKLIRAYKIVKKYVEDNPWDTSSGQTK